jgi:excinuclease ABC subunit C
MRPNCGTASGNLRRNGCLIFNMTKELTEKLAGASTGPGVYLMKDTDGRVIYVGKACNLKKRLGSYFSGKVQQDPKTVVLVKKINIFDTIVTETEKEALILESNLIKQYRPRYNVILKDDKRYPVLRLDVKSPYPNLCIARNIKKDGCLYFGPFSSAHAVRETLKIINKTFKLRKCGRRELRKRDRPCLNFQIGVCLAPCCLAVTQRDYQEVVNEVVMFLKGKTPDLIHMIQSEMTSAAQDQNYEKAACLRDKMFALKKTLEKQSIVSADLMDRDVLGIASELHCSVITLLSVRSGYLKGTQTFHFSETMASDMDLMESFIFQYYEKRHFVPAAILVSIPVESVGALEDFLYEIKGKKVRIICPQRGEKKRLANMAVLNAKTSLSDQKLSDRRDQDLLERLRKRLDLIRLPIRIECFDNSNLSGSSPVAAVVVFENAKPLKSEYRKYNITEVDGPDDYASMAEILHRRFRKNEDKRPLPDLLMLDGGKGQLNVAVSVINDLGLNGAFDIAAIAKKDPLKGEPLDKVYKPLRVNPIHFGKDEDLLLFLQRIRDESHRFAVSFHRRKRRGASLASELDVIPGIGKTRKNRLFKHFGTIKNIRAASLDELSALPGMNKKLASSLLDALQQDSR